MRFAAVATNHLPLSTLLVALVIQASGAEIRIPAFTAYTLPDPDGARIS